MDGAGKLPSLVVTGSVSVSVTVRTVGDLRALVALLAELDVPNERAVTQSGASEVSVEVLASRHGGVVRLEPVQKVSGVVIRKPAARLVSGAVYVNPFSDLREQWGRPREQ